MLARAVLVPFVVTLLLLVVACEADRDPPFTPTGGDPSLPGLTPTLAPTSPSTPTPEATPARPPDEGRRSGIPEVDAVIDAIVAEDLDVLTDLVLMRRQPCSSAGAVGGPPDCPPDVTAGAEVEAFPVGACELSWRRDVADTMRRLAEDADGGPYAVLKAPDDELEWVSYGDHIVVFQTKPASELVPSMGLGVFVEQGRIVYLNYLCPGRASDFLTWRGHDLEVVLPPPALEGTRTGIPGVDRVIEALASGDEEPLLEMVEYLEWPCADPEEVQGLGGPPRCDDGVVPGTIVRVFPVGFCEGTYVQDAATLLPTAPVRVAGVSALARRSQAEDPEPFWPDGQYIVVTAEAMGVVVEGGRIVRLQQGCNSVEALLDRGELLLRLPEDRTGSAAVDAVIEAVQAEDIETLGALMRLHEVPCDSPDWVGMGPPCGDSGGRELQPDAVLRAFPVSFCEVQWRSAPGGDARLARAINLPASLFAVVHFGTPPLPAFMPRANWGILFETEMNDQTIGMALLLDDDRIVMLDHLCIGPAELFLSDHPRYEAAEVILRASTAEARAGTMGTATPTPSATPRP